MTDEEHALVIELFEAFAQRLVDAVVKPLETYARGEAAPLAQMSEHGTMH